MDCDYSLIQSQTLSTMHYETPKQKIVTTSLVYGRNVEPHLGAQCAWKRFKTVFERLQPKSRSWHFFGPSKFIIVHMTYAVATVSLPKCTRGVNRETLTAKGYVRWRQSRRRLLSYFCGRETNRPEFDITLKGRTYIYIVYRLCTVVTDYSRSIECYTVGISLLEKSISAAWVYTTKLYKR